MWQSDVLPYGFWYADIADFACSSLHDGDLRPLSILVVGVGRRWYGCSVTGLLGLVTLAKTPESLPV